MRGLVIFNWRPKSWRRQRWFRPISYRGWEMVVMRVLLALIVWGAYPNHVSTADEGKERGLAKLVPLDWLADPATLALCKWVLLVALLVYAAGRIYVLSLGVMAFLTIAHGSLANSHGGIGHDMNILGLVLLGQWCWLSWRAVSRREFLSADRRSEVLNVFYTQQVMVATYLTTAVWKLYKTNFGWIREAKYFPVQLVKTRKAKYYDKLQEAGSEASGLMGKIDAWFANFTPQIEAFLFANPNICRAVIGSGLLLELFAFLALIGRRSRFFYGGMLVLFHLVIGRVMNLNFEQNILLLVVFFVNLPWLGKVFSPKPKVL